MKILLNKAKCKICGEVLVSDSSSEYKFCSCGAVGVAGGSQSILRLGHHNHIIEMSQKDYA